MFQVWSQPTLRQAWPLFNVVCLALTLRIDQKVSNSPSGYKLQEAQAILSEVRSIRDAISSGEKEKQELMQVTFVLLTRLLFFFTLAHVLSFPPLQQLP